MTDLTCPKCQSSMRRYERNGVHVDQCTGCGGLFLDRGELEHLVQAEQAWSAPVAARPQAQGYGHGASTHHRKRRSFLEDLFD